MTLPFDGAISDYFRDDAPADIRAQIEDGRKKDVLDPDFPYDTVWGKSEYETAIDHCQRELVKLQADVKATGKRVCILFEGRDAAGKGGTIKRFRENLNPRGARVVALSKPSEAEASQWYFQRYIDHLPSAGQIVFFDRSWYNRGVVEKVFDFVGTADRERWFRQVGPFEQMLVDEGIILHKLWLNVGRAEQLRRFLGREQNPLKQWKLSWIDVEGLKRWDAYSDAIEETLRRTHTEAAPWTVVRSEDKKRARVNAIRSVLSGIDYAGKDTDQLGPVDPKIAGGPDVWNG